MNTAEPFKEGDPVIYSKFENRSRHLVDCAATFVRYQTTAGRPMAVIRMDSTGRVVQVATRSISRAA